MYIYVYVYVYVYMNSFLFLYLQSKGYAPLSSDFDSFYVRRLQKRLNDCFTRPTTGVPGRTVSLLDREFLSSDFTQFNLTGTYTRCLNFSSYNYLGFAQSKGPCADAVSMTIDKWGLSSTQARAETGTLEFHKKVENLVAEFTGKPAAIVFSMGFGTNATMFPALVSKGCLVISDELNHASIRFGVRLSGAFVRMFKHNDVADLERVLRDAISQGQTRTHRPWKKILVVVEGLYSMEGTLVNLRGILELKEKYKFYLYVDEAHSIGAIGPNGKGVCDYFSVSPTEIDILMGTFTKSFGAAGGYVAASEDIIDRLRLHNATQVYAESMSPVVLAQIEASVRIINGDIGGAEGQDRLQRLAFNTRYLRMGLKRMGFILYGHDDSPVVP